MDRVLHTLRARFGHDAFRPGQEALVRALLQGRDALGLLPTGGGKSLTYLLPAHLLPRTLVVISPLVALMEDQLRRARASGLRAEALAGPVPPARVRSVLGEVAAGRLDLVFLAPERLRGPTGRHLLALPLGGLVVDEAHCLVQWGFDFRPDYLVLAGLGPRLGLPVLALTATATPTLRRTLVATLGLREPEMVVQSFDRPNLAWEATRIPEPGARWSALWQAVREVDGDLLVYAGTRGEVDRIALALRHRGLRTGRYHAGLDPEERSRTLTGFLEGSLRAIVATNAFGMGVDKPDIRAVLHWAPPASLEAYYQEAGRGGRDGAPARARVLWHPADLRHLRRRLAGSFPSLLFLGRLAVEIRRRGRPRDPDGWARLARRLGWGGMRDGGEALGRVWHRLHDGETGGWSRAFRDRRAALRRLEAVRRYLRPGIDRRTELLAYFGEDRGAA